MARKLRKQIDAPEAIYHIVCRGVNQRNIFRLSPDYRMFLKILKKAKEKYGFYLYSYSLLPNHIHFQIKVNDVSVSKIMHYINTCYAVYFNQKYKRTGHLFQDRFYASLIDTESYFWAVSAYIDLNALRAGLIKSPESYPWNSYQFYFKGNFKDSLIDEEQFLSLGGDGDIESLRQEYLEFVKEESKKEKKPKFISNKKFI